MVHVIRNIVLFFCCCIAIFSVAQVPGITIYTLSGESQEKPRINVLYQLKDGYILVGTTNGLYRFDGINFFEFNKSLNVPDDVTAICELPDKNILLGFSNGKIGKLQNNISLYISGFNVYSNNKNKTNKSTRKLNTNNRYIIYKNVIL